MQATTFAYPGDEGLSLKEKLDVNPNPDGIEGLTGGGFFRKYGYDRAKPIENPYQKLFNETKI